MFYNITAVFIGGGAGCALRFLIGEIFLKNFSLNLPAATFLVNVSGGLLIGFLFALFTAPELAAKPEINPAVKFALTAGFCGGLTTFSTFSLELFEMIEHAEFIQATAYAVLSVAVCLAAVWMGVYLAKLV
ncbi:MAG: fluoride efflux transporter CrcB [Heliobacteriaceae bacterium]|jgi:CrcB protein|nr:fluoride efflux transporter CrcB [Heliobacteriaceae bacterium]